MSDEVRLYNNWVMSDIFCVRNTRGNILAYGAILISNTMKMYVIGDAGLECFLKNPSLFSCYSKDDIAMTRDWNSNVITHFKVASTVIKTKLITVNWKSIPSNDNRLAKKAYIEYKGWSTDDIGTLTPRQMLSRIK